MTTLCRDCLWSQASAAPNCPRCGRERLIEHTELGQLTIAHVDCDAFYASVEKRDRPELKDKPVLIGGGKRGVVSTACYVARRFGVRSAMPMFKALNACPHAVVIKPDMAKYTRVARDIRTKMQALTPLVEPLSLDEAFLDLGGTERLHKRTAAESLAQLALAIETDIGITVSVGLSYNKFLAKIASDLRKPRGFAVIGRMEARDFLARLPATVLPGVGPKMAQALGRMGLVSIADIQRTDEKRLARQFGEMGLWLARLSRGEDTRGVSPEGERKTISAESTFEDDIASLPVLSRLLWTLSERVSSRAKAAGCGGRTIVLKLKTHDFQSRTRQVRTPKPTQSAHAIFAAGEHLLKLELDGTRFRLLGIGLNDLVDAAACDLPDLFDAKSSKIIEAERAVDKLKAKFGANAIRKGRSL